MGQLLAPAEGSAKVFLLYFLVYYRTNRKHVQLGIKWTIGHSKLDIGDWGLGIGDWGLGNMLKLVGIDWNRLEYDRVD